MGALGGDGGGGCAWADGWATGAGGHPSSCRGGAGDSVSSPHARRLGAGVLLGTSLRRWTRLHGWSQVGGPFDDEAGGWAGWAGGFVPPPSTGSTSMILKSSLARRRSRSTRFHAADRAWHQARRGEVAAVADRGHRPWNPGRAAAPWVKGGWAGTPPRVPAPASSSAEQRRAGVAAEEVARVADQHLLDLAVGDATLAQAGQQRAVDVGELPVEQDEVLLGIGEPVGERGLVVGEHDPVGVAALAELGQGVQLVGERHGDLQPAAVPADVGPVGDDLFQVAQVGA